VKKKWMMVLAAAMGMAVISMAADLSGGKTPTDREALQETRAQIAELRAKVQTLEADTRRLESVVEQLKQSHAPTPLNFPAPQPSQLNPAPVGSRPPTIWGQGEVNGWTYYVVPCEQQGR
jgi:outer membrane murein-binding lipoprotein Lpp